MSTHSICFHGEIRKIIIWMTLLSRDMSDDIGRLNIYKPVILAAFSVQKLMT